MANSSTPYINNINVSNIRAQIAQKKGYNPYLATVSQASSVLTDYDTFPYPRWFRGIPRSTRPVVAEREAGWRQRHDNCYKVLQPEMAVPRPNHCFQSACNLTRPCYPQPSSEKHFDAMDSCIVQYR